MAAVTLQSQGVKCQATFHVNGGGNGELALTFLRPFAGDFLPFVVRHETRCFQLVFTNLAVRDGWGGNRSRWELRGVVLSDEFAVTDPHAGVRYAQFELDYNTHTRSGVLKILAHDQPPPLIDALEWHQALSRINNMAGSVIEVRYEGSGSLARAIIGGVSFSSTGFEIECCQFFTLVVDANRTPQWIVAEDRFIRCNLSTQDPGLPRPLAFKDGRIVFEAVVKGGRVIFTAYPNRTTVAW